MANLDLLLGRLDVLLLIFSRFMGLFTTGPIFSNRFVQVPARVVLALACGLVVYPLFRDATVPGDFVGLMGLTVRELAVGMILGFVASLPFAAVQLAGDLLDLDLGFAMVNILDPMSGQPLPMIGNLKHLLALMIFFSIGGDHGLLLAVMDSYTSIPLGTFTPTGPLSETVLKLGGDLFRQGLTLAAPVLAALFLTTVALAVVGRAVPQMNIFVVGLPVKAGAGVAMLAALLPLYLTVLVTLFDRLFAHLYNLLPLMGGGA